MTTGKVFSRLAIMMLVCVTGLPGPIEAQVTNGTFDGFTPVAHPGWDHVGLLSGRYDFVPNSPNLTEPPVTMQTPDSFTFNQPEGGASSAEIATLFGAPVTEADIVALDTSPAIPTFGAAIAQTFNVAAGEQVTFQWNFVSFDSFGLDFAFVYLNGSSGMTLARLAGQQDVSPVPDDLEGISGETGLMTFTSAPLAAGSYRFGLGVMNSKSNENAGTSALVADNVTLVPEPVTTATAGLALLALGSAARRSRRDGRATKA